MLPQWHQARGITYKHEHEHAANQQLSPACPWHQLQALQGYGHAVLSCCGELTHAHIKRVNKEANEHTHSTGGENDLCVCVCKQLGAQRTQATCDRACKQCVRRTEDKLSTCPGTDGKGGEGGGAAWSHHMQDKGRQQRSTSSFRAFMWHVRLEITADGWCGRLPDTCCWCELPAVSSVHSLVFVVRIP